MPCLYGKIRTRKQSAKKRIKTGKKWNPPLFGIRNPLCWNPESSTRDPESTAWNPESKTVLDSLTWGDFTETVEKISKITYTVSPFSLLTSAKVDCLNQD